MYLTMFPEARLCRRGVSERQRAAHFGHAYIDTQRTRMRRGADATSIAASRVAAQAKQFHLTIRHNHQRDETKATPINQSAQLQNPLPDLGSRFPLPGSLPPSTLPPPFLACSLAWLADTWRRVRHRVRRASRARAERTGKDAPGLARGCPERSEAILSYRDGRRGREGKGKGALGNFFCLSSYFRAWAMLGRER